MKPNKLRRRGLYRPPMDKMVREAEVKSERNKGNQPRKAEEANALDT